MTEDETNELIMELQGSTALGRLGHGEVKTAIERLSELGYVIQAPASHTSERSNG